MHDKVGFGRNINQLNESVSIEEHIRGSMMYQLVGQYGWQVQNAECYINEYLRMDQSERFVSQISNRYDLLKGKKVLEVGSGLGNVLIKMRLYGINAIGIEPSEEFYSIIVKRLEQHKLELSSIKKGYAENLPFDDFAFDFVHCLQVLEHVNDPEMVLSEINRVLRPGGICYITAPNYMSFRENHYRVFYLPMMPKFLARLYLYLHRRNPEFLLNHVNYITFVKINRITNRLKWDNLTLKSLLEKLENPMLIMSKPKRAIVMLINSLSPSLGSKIGKLIYYFQNLFRSEIVYQYCKQ